MSDQRNKEKNTLFIGIAICLGLTLVTYFFGRLLVDIPHLPDTGASWYYWKLPAVNIYARISAWTLFALHLGLVWFFMYKLKKDPSRINGKISKYNRFLLATNFIFVLLHFVQTGLWYDGLAQDVTVWSSQFSVIGMLVLILLMENSRRGLFFGKKLKFVTNAAPSVYKFHGIYIAWALIYTFWFHPMENTPGHLFGFFYMFILLLQLSMAYTSVHTNKYWTFTLEIMVLFHGTAVALLQNNGIWPMFFFGFGAIFVVTQLYGLDLSKKTIFSWTTVYAIAVLLVYSGLLFNVRTIARIHEITWIPIIEYGLVLVLALVFNIPKLVNKKK